MHRPEAEAEPQFSQPIQQILTMLVIIALVGTGAWLAYRPILQVVQSNIWLNGVIIGVFVIGVATCFWRMFTLVSSVAWIEGFAMNRPGHEHVRPPRLLLSLATLLRARGKQHWISASSSRSILDSMATRLDENSDITRYIINLLIFLGLLGTFYGLATTVPAVVDTIRSLAPAEGESGVEVFDRLMTGLERQLGGMGTAFSSSLLGLAGSLVVGLLDLFTGHGQNRFYRELEEWLSTITRVGFAPGEGEAAAGAGIDTGALELAYHRMSESLEALHSAFVAAENGQVETARRLGELSAALESLGERLGDGSPGTRSAEVEKALVAQTALLSRIAEGQEKLAAALTEADEDEAGGVDPETRMRLRSIDTQLLRVLEEMMESRQDVVTQLRAEIAGMTRAIRALARKGAQQDRPAQEDAAADSPPASAGQG